MKAIVLTAGLGTRLGELSRTKPKCLQEVGGGPLLDHLFQRLTDVGVDEMLVNTHHLAHVLEEHIRKSRWATRVTIVHEPELLGTLGTVRANLEFFDGAPGMVLHGDNYHVGGLGTLLDAFESRPAGVWAVAGAFRVDDPWNYGVFVTTKSGIVEEFWEKANTPPTSLANAATYIFAPQVFDLIHSMNMSACDISRDLLPGLISRLMAVELPDAVVDIGTPERLARARNIKTCVKDSDKHGS